MRRIFSQMQIFVKMLTGQTITLEANPSDTVTELKRKVQEKEGFKAHRQRLLYIETPLEDDRTLSQYDIHDGSTLHLIVRLLVIN